MADGGRFDVTPTEAGALGNLLALSSSLVRAVTPEDVVHVLDEHGAALTCEHTCALYLVDWDAEEAWVASGTAREELQERYARVPLSVPFPLSESARKGEVVTVVGPDAFRQRYPPIADEMEAEGTRSLVCVPLPPADRPIGVLAVAFPEPHELTDLERAVLSGVTSQLAVALERARLEQSERQLLMASAEQAERMSLILAATDTGWWEWDAVRDEVSWSPSVAAMFGLSGAGPPSGYREYLDLVHHEDREALQRLVERALTTGTGYEVAHRIVADEGKRWLWARAQALRDHAGRVVKLVGIVRDVTARRSEELRRRSSDARVRQVLDGLFTFAGLTTPDGVLVGVNRTALEVAGLRAEDVLGKPMWETHWWAWDEEVQAAVREAVGRAAGGESSRYDTQVMVSDGRVLDIDFQLTPLRDESGKIVNLVPSAIDITERLAIEQERRQLLERATVAADTIERMSRSLDLDDQLEVLASIVVPRLADWLALTVQTPTGPRSLLRHADPRQRALGEAFLRRYRDRTLYRTGTAPTSRDPVLVESLTPAQLAEYARDDDHLAALASMGLQSAIVVPLVSRGREVGWLALVTADSHRRYGEDDLRLAREIAGRAAIAVDNALLLDRQRNIALELQHSLLPREPLRVPGLAVTARYQPAISDLEVGGDWYDTLSLSDGRVLLVVGDIVGRGLEAAAAMGQLRNATQAFASTDTDPLDLLAQLDRFAGTMKSASYATAAVVEVDAGRRRLRSARAGHMPSLVVSERGEVTMLWGGARPPLGIPLRHVGASSAAEAVFGPGCCVLLFTDGLVERREESIDRGLERVSEAAAALWPGRSLDQFVDDLIAELRSEPVEDDICLVAATPTVHLPEGPSTYDRADTDPPTVERPT